MCKYYKTPFWKNKGRNEQIVIDKLKGESSYSLGEKYLVSRTHIQRIVRHYQNCIADRYEELRAQYETTEFDI